MVYVVIQNKILQSAGLYYKYQIRRLNTLYKINRIYLKVKNKIVKIAIIKVYNTNPTFQRGIEFVNLFGSKYYRITKRKNTRNVL